MTEGDAACAAVLLAPGAGADRNQSALMAVDAALTAEGFTVARMDFPYRKARRRAPDRPPVLIRAVLEEAQALATAAACAPEAIAMGGRSMGGRVCSLAVADGLPAAALILISYPLHPPGRPERPRTEHFPRLTLPCLFVSGTRDTFGTPEELTAATATIPGPVTHHWIEGKGHGLRGCDAAVVEVVRSFLTGSPRRG
jgi:predicted alpha/beta-hydrolase family hydrolase